MMKSLSSKLLLLCLILLCALKLSSGQFLFSYEINQESDDSRAPKSSLFDPSSFRIVTPSQLQSSYQKIASGQQLTTAEAPTQQSTSPLTPALESTSGRVSGGTEEPQSLLKQTSAALQSFADLFSLAPSSSPAPLPLPLAENSVSAQSPDQQAEARSLHEHWSQQKQAQQQSVATSALTSFTTSQPNPNPQQHHQHQQHQNLQHHQQSNQASPQASYWLTANPLNSPDGNYLVQIKQRDQSSQQAQPTSPATLVDNLLSLAHRSSARPVHNNNNNNKPQLAVERAQSSFLATPTSYYPNPVESSTRVAHLQTETPAPPPTSMRHFTPPEQADTNQLRPPANVPENFPPVHHKSAEDTLISFRQQQNQLFASQNQLAQSANQRNSNQASSEGNQLNRQIVSQTTSQVSDIPKVSPQIYESFLLQQRDQHEKHMELLKQQQELNKLLDRKHEQQEIEQKRKRKKEQEQEKARKLKQARDQEAARKLKMEQEEQLRLVQRRREDEAAERKRAEERRMRELAELREREAQAKRAQQQQRAEEEARIREREEKSRREADEKKRREKEADEAKYANYMRQQAELRKLLELKQREDEAQQQRRRQLTANQQRQVNRAAKLSSLEASRERASWGTPLRTRVQSLARDEPLISTTTQAPLISSETPVSASSAAPESVREVLVQRRQKGHLIKKQRTLGDERLIRQKIPLYSGAGKYGLYRGLNDSSAQDLAALLDSVTLSVPTSTTTTTTTQSPAPATPTQAPTLASEPAVRHSEADSMSSLSPLLQRASPAAATPTPPSHFESANNEPFFDDDVPRRPARGLSQQRHQRQQPIAAASMRSQTRSNATTSPTQSRPAHIGLASLPPDADNDGIPGRAGVEYPVLSSVPPTSFSCAEQPLNGYYADTETACQVVHLCQSGVQSSILCPNGTIFNQEKFSCQWWYEVNCSRAPNFYQLNDNLYKSQLPNSNDKDKTSISANRNKTSRQQTNNNLLS